MIPDRPHKVESDPDDDFLSSGFTLDDLDLDHPALIITPELRMLITSHHRPRRHWWNISDHEHHHIDDLPHEFERMGDRARWMITQSARLYMSLIGCTDDDAAVLEDSDGKMVSLNDLLARVDYEDAAIMRMRERTTIIER